MRAAVLFLGCCVCGAAFGQSDAGKRLEFEVASVRPATDPPGPGVPRGISGGPGTPDPGQVACTYVPLHDLLGWAYALQYDQISGPGSLTTEHYNIVAKVPAGATREQLNVMLQNLLADRFHLIAHMVKKDFTAYELTVVKGGLKLKESGSNQTPPALGPDGRPVRVPLTFKDGYPVLAPGGYPASWELNVKGRELLAARAQDMESIVRLLRNSLGLGVRVIDKTGLAGKYDFRLQWAQPNTNAAAAAQDLPDGADFLDSVGEPAPDLITAVRQQLGLVLTKGVIPIDVLVVDHVDKTPTDN
jgi:uncharacterized protein (TIGR03435 family)